MNELDLENFDLVLVRKKDCVKKTTKSPCSFWLSDYLVEKARDVIYWSPGMTVSDFVETALNNHIQLYEKERGAVFPKRQCNDKYGYKARCNC